MRLLAQEDGQRLRNMPFMSNQNFKLLGADTLISRCGYTGEDGFEVCIPNSKVETFASALLDNRAVKLAGLAARDTLRLEAGLCLYGNDIDEQTTPAQAGLLWTIPKSRREDKQFLGADKILAEIQTGVSKKRVGFVHDGPPARTGYLIKNNDGTVIGNITSGTHSCVLKKPVSMGYVDSAFATVGKVLNIEARGKLYPATIVKMPFVASNYKK